MRRTLIRAMAGALCPALAVALAACAEATGDPSDAPLREGLVTLTEVATAEAPSAGAAGPDGTLWIAERAGRVRVLDEHGLGEPVLDLTDQTTTDGERGLLGLAFDPDFAHLYLSFTDRDGHTRVDEVAVADGRPRPESRRTVLRQEQPFANHNGGNLAFGPDRKLYLGLGDGGGGGDPLRSGQDLGTLLGKLLRIDPQPTGDHAYTVPFDNPFIDQPGARPEIWAYGLRNPWRFSFDAATGDLWIADVGQSAREEIDWAAAGTGAGANYGWSIMEGSGPYGSRGPEPENHTPPVFEYETRSDRCSITGGYVYRGEAIPDLRGEYLFSDYCDGGIRAFSRAAGETDLGVDGGSVVGFAQGPDLELYVLDLAGPIHRLDPAPAPSGRP
jgi:glucose/arabinose dehydrogenase